MKKEDITLEVIGVGGFVLEYYNLRGTQDVDAFYQENTKILSIIKQVGDKFGVNEPDELWLNNSVSNLNKVPPKSACKVIYNFSNLKVLIPTLIYIVGMKMESGRNRDRQDIDEIIRLANISSPKGLLNDLKGYNFNIDISILLEAFEIAYGTEWLAEYMSNHIDEFKEY